MRTIINRLFFSGFIVLTLLQATFGQVEIAAKANVESSSARQDISIKPQINAGTELITIMLWLSGKYPMPMDSKYKSEVWTRFSKYKQHSALERMKRSELYPDFTEIGLLLSDFPNIKIETPETNSWYEKGGRENIVGILNDAKVFAKETKFWNFYQKHQAQYARLTDDFANELKEKNVLPTIDSFFRYGASRPRPQVTIYLESLNNWGAHAIDFQRLRGEPNGERVIFQIGPVEQDSQLPDSPLAFKTNRQTIQNVWHEASHIYLKKALADDKERISKLDRLFNAPSLASQNIKTWDYAFEENLVRAIVAAVTKQKLGDDAYKREIATQTQRGFIYTNEMAEMILSKYVSDTNRYATFDDFIPEIIAVMETKQSPSDVKK